MSPLQYETMMIVPLQKPRRLTLFQSHDLVLCVNICWATRWFFDTSPFRPKDYWVQTIGMDGVS